MVFCTAFRVRHNAFEDLCNTFRNNFQTGFLQHFAADAGFQCFTCLQHAPWEGPVSFSRLTASFRQKDAGTVENKRAYSQDRPFWIAAANRWPLP